jgi:glycosyltransferase involved in cell wall biosynthesis
MAEMVQDGINGLHFTPGDPASLAARLRQLVQDPGLVARLREGIKPVKSVAEEMAELLAIYSSLMGDSGSKEKGGDAV